VTDFEFSSTAGDAAGDAARKATAPGQRNAARIGSVNFFAMFKSIALTLYRFYLR